MNEEERKNKIEKLNGDNQEQFEIIKKIEKSYSKNLLIDFLFFVFILILLILFLLNM